MNIKEELKRLAMELYQAISDNDTDKMKLVYVELSLLSKSI